MILKEITVYTTTEASELVCDIMWSVSTGGVSVYDVRDAIEFNKKRIWDYIDDNLLINSGEVMVKCYVSKEDTVKILKYLHDKLVVLKADFPYDAGSLETVTREVDGDEWVENWKKHYKPIKINNVVICPEWIDYVKSAGETVVKIDPGMAFGTGEHETTTICIELMQEYLKKDDIVIDVGCGSGILGITAARLGARKCMLTDIDSIAVRSAQLNAKLNNVGGKIHAALSDLLDNNKEKADLIISNITADVLLVLAPQIKKNIKKGGTIILSGIISEKLEQVKNFYTAAGFEFVKQINKNDWHGVVFKC